MAGIGKLYALIDQLRRNVSKNAQNPMATLEQGVYGLRDQFREDPVNAVLGSSNLGGMVGMTKALRATPKAPQADALEAARRNAVEMLGLPENNTAMDRAKALGYLPAFHGTADDIAQLDPLKFGSSTGSKSAKQAFWAVSDPSTARGYAEYAATDSKVKKLMDLADKAEAKGNWDLYDKLLQQAEDMESRFQSQPLQGQNIMPLMIRANKGVRGVEMDAKGAEFVDLEGGVNRLLNEAKLGNKDLAVFKNLSDDVGFNGRPANHYAVINPSLVRSRFAAFDPARINENDLLGKVDPRLNGLLAIGALGGAGAYGYLKENK